MLPTQSRYNRRRRALGEAANAIRRTLSARLLEVLGLEYALIDSLPIGVVNFAHSKQAHRWYGHAEYGFNASKQETVYGFRLHVLMTQSGLVLDYALLPANVADIHVAPQLLRCVRGIEVLGDKAYIKQEWQRYLRERDEIRTYAVDNV